MDRTRLFWALAFLCGAFVSPARAAVTLVEPVALDNKVTDLKTAVAADADPVSLVSKVQQMFDQAQDTHHLPVSGIGQWQRPEKLSATATEEEATAQQALDHFTKIISKEPPPPITAAPSMQNRILEDYTAFADLVGNDRVKKDENGQLPKNAVAAYVWDVAKSAKDGAVDGMILAQPELFKASKQLGEFILATIGAHEPRHRVEHIQDAAKLADDVKDDEVESFRDQGALMQWLDPSGEKFMWLWTVTVERPGTSEFVTQYMKHLAQVRHAYAEGDEGLKRLVKELGYHDKPGSFQATQQAVQQPSAPADGKSPS